LEGEEGLSGAIFKKCYYFPLWQTHRYVTSLKLATLVFFFYY